VGAILLCFFQYLCILDRLGCILYVTPCITEQYLLLMFCLFTLRRKNMMRIIFTILFKLLFCPRAIQLITVRNLQISKWIYD
jgi:hypothetical protein